ncbi:hypothetical protein AB1K70_05310 [Bremerella sp. JC770]|uniref:hypothetical protein n=1 Tax=Bremerella sp. JC770 TaxID=3232137 RepID=UPI003458D5D6
MNRLTLLAVVLTVFGVGCDESSTGLKGVQGNVTVDGKPAPEGTRISFEIEGGTYSFSTSTDSDGKYAYLPPPEAPLMQGTYGVSVVPLSTTSVMDASGLPQEVKIKGAPTTYGKFSNPETSGIRTILGGELITLDIKVET